MPLSRARRRRYGMAAAPWSLGSDLVRHSKARVEAAPWRSALLTANNDQRAFGPVLPSSTRPHPATIATLWRERPSSPVQYHCAVS